MFNINFYKYISGVMVIVASLFTQQALAISSCSSITNYDELSSTGACLSGPDNRVIFTNFNTSVPREKWKDIKVSTATRATPPVEGGAVGVYALTFNTMDLGIAGISFSFDAICDASCEMNDGVYSLEGNAGDGIWVINGKQFKFKDDNLYTPIFTSYVKTLQQYGSYTQTAIPGLSPSEFSFGVNIIPTGKTAYTDDSCPVN